MKELNEAQLAVIKDYLRKENIYNERLYTDLLDHFSILIENEMVNGVTFENAFQWLITIKYPNGVSSIQKSMEEMVYYPTFLSRNFLLFVGSILILLQFFGLFLAKWHSPYKAKLFVIANHTSSFIFLPLLLVYSMFRVRNKALVIYIFMIIQTANYALYSLVMHNGAQFYFLPISGIVILSLSYYIYQNQKIKW